MPARTRSCAYAQPAFGLRDARLGDVDEIVRAQVVVERALRGERHRKALRDVHHFGGAHVGASPDRDLPRGDRR